VCLSCDCVLKVPLPDVVRMQTRQPNLEGIGEISLRHLVREALRMRPQRIVGKGIVGREMPHPWASGLGVHRRCFGLRFHEWGGMLRLGRSEGFGLWLRGRLLWGLDWSGNLLAT
jgi:hypothetical protein